MIKKLARLTCVAWVFIVLLWAKPSHAYPWMIQHQYTGCALCHMDPSGGYLLTAYGRAQTQALLSSFGKGKQGDEVDSRSNFAFGLMAPNEYVTLGASVREAYWYEHTLGTSASTPARSILMQADFRAALTLGPVVVTGSIGYLPNGNHAAQITKGNQNVLVSREFWVGLHLGEEKGSMIRVGRMYLPFGIRFVEHRYYVRLDTGTNIDYQQQMGAAFFHETEKYRMEVMAIAGNYQIAPDDYRQRGYAGYLEYSLQPGMQLGFSSMVTYSKLDPGTLKNSAFTGAHGPMFRWSPIDNVAILSELDLTHFSASQTLTQYGLVGISQIDWEMVRGLHAMVTGEIYHPAQLDDPQGHHFNNRDWFTLAWFMYPHIDLRSDTYWATEWAPPVTRTNSWASMWILHVSL